MSKAYTVTNCQVCGQYAPCKQVTFFQNIGVLVMRFSRTTQGLLCKPCIDATFIRSSAISALFGWWGIISFFYTLFTLPMNVVTWGGAQTLPQPSAFYTKQGHAGALPPGSPGASMHQGPHSGPPSPGAHGAHAAVDAPAAGSGPDVVAYGSLALAALGFGATILCTALGLAMMIWPTDDKSADAGLTCMLATAVVCGGPALLGLGLGAFRLLSKRKS